MQLLTHLCALLLRCSDAALMLLQMLLFGLSYNENFVRLAMLQCN